MNARIQCGDVRGGVDELFPAFPVADADLGHRAIGKPHQHHVRAADE